MVIVKDNIVSGSTNSGASVLFGEKEMHTTLKSSIIIKEFNA